MPNTTIIQIMPAPQNLYALYSDPGGVGVFDGDVSPYIYDPVAALALVENLDNGHRFVEPVVCDTETGVFAAPTSVSNFAGLCYREARPAEAVSGNFK